MKDCIKVENRKEWERIGENRIWKPHKLHLLSPNVKIQHR